MKLHPIVIPSFLLTALALVSGCGGSSTSTTSAQPDTLVGTLRENLSNNPAATPTPLAGWTVYLNSAGSPVNAVTAANGSFSLRVPANDVSATGNPLILTPPTGYSGPLTTETTKIVGLSSAGEQELIVEVTIDGNGTVTVQ